MPEQNPRMLSSLASLTMGRQADGAPWTVDLRQANVTVGGVPGSGKSGWINLLLGHLAFLPAVRVVVVDLKFGVEAEPWRRRISEVIDNTDDAVDLVERLLRIVETRYRHMRAVGVRNAWVPGYLTADDPVLVVVFDEVADLFPTATREEKDRTALVTSRLRQLVSLGRAAGVITVLSTQKPTAESLPTAIRDLTTVRVCFKTTTAAQTEAVLGDGWRESGLNPADFDAVTQRGYAVATGTSGGLVLCRTALLTDEHVADIVARTAHLQRPLAD